MARVIGPEARIGDYVQIPIGWSAAPWHAAPAIGGAEIDAGTINGFRLAAI